MSGVVTLAIPRPLRLGDRGRDVRHRQQAANKFFASIHSHLRLSTDGVVGDDTLSKFRDAAYLSGAPRELYRDKDTLWRREQYCVQYPKLRSGEQKRKSNWRVGHHFPSGNALLYADISGNNESVDLRKYGKAGYRRIVIKLTEGDYFVSDSARERWRLALTLGLERWLYHFARPSENPGVTGARREAQWFVRHAMNAGVHPRDKLMLDWEDGKFTGGHTEGNVWVRAFRTEVNRLRPHVRLEILYAYSEYARRTLTSCHGMRYVHASYVESKNGGPTSEKWSPVPLWARRSLEAVQFTDGKDGDFPHTAPGIGNCDMNMIIRRGVYVPDARYN